LVSLEAEKQQDNAANGSSDQSARSGQQLKSPPADLGYLEILRRFWKDL
jgi:hypothetical protein